MDPDEWCPNTRENMDTDMYRGEAACGHEGIGWDAVSTSQGMLKTASNPPKPAEITGTDSPRSLKKNQWADTLISAFQSLGLGVNTQLLVSHPVCGAVLGQP